MSRLIMLVGLAGSGKSTYAKENFSNCIILSSDSIREELYGDASIQGDNNKIFNILHSRAVKNLKEGKDIVYDATNLSMKRRMSFLKQINHLVDEKCCYVFITPYEECIHRQTLRERKVPAEVIMHQLKQFQCPDFYEGWDKVELIIDDTCKKYDKDYYKLNNFNQDNPNHSLTASEHMHKTWDYAFRQAEGDIILEVAAAHHDIGKYLTKTFVNRKGETTEVAHYYGHQNVGAYLLLQKCYDKYMALYYMRAAILVQWHMEHYIRDEKGMEKLYNLLGPRQSHRLKELYKFDKAAH